MFFIFSSNHLTRFCY